MAGIAGEEKTSEGPRLGTTRSRWRAFSIETRESVFAFVVFAPTSPAREALAVAAECLHRWRVLRTGCLRRAGGSSWSVEPVRAVGVSVSRARVALAMPFAPPHAPCVCVLPCRDCMPCAVRAVASHVRWGGKERQGASRGGLCLACFVPRTQAFLPPAMTQAMEGHGQPDLYVRPEGAVVVGVSDAGWRVPARLRVAAGVTFLCFCVCSPLFCRPSARSAGLSPLLASQPRATSTCCAVE